MMREQIVVLRVRYDDHYQGVGTKMVSPPGDWHWSALAGEDCVVLAAGAVVDVESEPSGFVVADTHDIGGES